MLSELAWATDPDTTVLVCTARRMVAIGPRSLAETRSVDEIRDLTLKRRYASVEEPRFREFVATVSPAEPTSRLAGQLAAACRVGRDRDPVCRLVPRWTMQVPAAKVANRDHAEADETGRIILQGADPTMFRASATTITLTPEGLFTIVRHEGKGRSEMEEGLCARAGE